MSGEVGEVIAVASDYDGLLRAMIARRHELRLSQIVVDDIAGLADRHLSKIEAKTKRLGVMSLTALLPALGLELVVRRTVPHHERQGRLPPAGRRGVVSGKRSPSIPVAA